MFRLLPVVVCFVLPLASVTACDHCGITASLQFTGAAPAQTAAPSMVTYTPSSYPVSTVSTVNTVPLVAPLTTTVAPLATTSTLSVASAPATVADYQLVPVASAQPQFLGNFISPFLGNTRNVLCPLCQAAGCCNSDSGGGSDHAGDEFRRSLDSIKDLIRTYKEIREAFEDESVTSIQQPEEAAPVDNVRLAELKELRQDLRGLVDAQQKSPQSRIASAQQ